MTRYTQRQMLLTGRALSRAALERIAVNQPRSAWRRALAGLTAAAVATLGFVATAPAASAADTPDIKVYLADGTTPYVDQPVHDGDTLVVKGTGFDPEANVGGERPLPIPPELPQGTYITFGSFSPVWAPSKNAPSDARKPGPLAEGAQVWALAEDVLNQVPAQYQGAIRAAWAPIAADGSFTATVKIVPPSEAAVNGVWGIYTYPAGGVINAAQELSVTVNYVGADDAAPVDKTPVVKKKLKKAKPVITGKAKVGKTLKVKIKKAKWTKNTKFTVKWLADGKVIKTTKNAKYLKNPKKATTLKLTKKLQGKKITVQVIGKKAGFAKATANSKATVKVKK